MRKSSRSISLALIGTSLALGGCGGKADDEWSEGEGLAQAPAGADPNAQGIATGTNQYGHHSGGYYSPGRTAARVGGAMIGSQLGRNLGGGGGSVAPGAPHPAGGVGGMGGGATSAPSSRGGFGSSAGHSGGASS